jgi:hypothetical protein
MGARNGAQGSAAEYDVRQRNCHLFPHSSHDLPSSRHISRIYRSSVLRTRQRQLRRPAGRAGLVEGGKHSIDRLFSHEPGSRVFHAFDREKVPDTLAAVIRYSGPFGQCVRSARLVSAFQREPSRLAPHHVTF